MKQRKQRKPILKIKVQSLQQLANASYTALERSTLSKADKERAVSLLEFHFDAANSYYRDADATEVILKACSEAFTASGYRMQLSGRFRAKVLRFVSRRDAERAAAEAEARRITEEADRRAAARAEALAKRRAAIAA